MKRFARLMSLLLVAVLCLGLCSCSFKDITDRLWDLIFGRFLPKETVERLLPPPNPEKGKHQAVENPDAANAPDVAFEDIATSESMDAGLNTALAAAAADLQKEADVSALGFTDTSIRPYMTQFFFLHPELFYLSSSYSMSYDPDTRAVKRVVFNYIVDEADIPAMRTAYQSAVDEITAGIPAGATEFDKILYLHDYLIRHYSYDYAGLQAEQAGTGNAIRDAYHFFTLKTGVCQAYTLALTALAQKVGLDCLPVISEPLQHAWNMIKIDGAWYHIDVTWDDPGGDDAPVYPTYVSYKNFLLSDEALFRSDELRQKGWTATQKAESKTYDGAAWREADTPVLRQGDVYYCMLFDADAIGEGALALYGGTATELNLVRHFAADWGYQAAWSTLCDYDGVLVFNTANTISLYDIRVGTLVLRRRVDLTVALGGKKIYGICSVASDGTVTYVAAADYRGDYTLETCKIPD